MDWVWIALGIALLVVCLIYALYQNGYAILSFKAALTYMGCLLYTSDAADE